MAYGTREMLREQIWRDDAKGIPAWETAMQVKYQGVWVLNLAHPDTCAAYDRRLAIALGCPEEVAAEGVRFYIDQGCGPQIDAGFDPDASITTAWSFDLRDLENEELTNTDDPLLARALAWPADKRVVQVPDESV